jgi:hypothetical protein
LQETNSNNPVLFAPPALQEQADVKVANLLNRFAEVIILQSSDNWRQNMSSKVKVPQIRDAVKLINK